MIGIAPAGASAGITGGAAGSAIERLPGSHGPVRSGTLSLEARRADHGAIQATAKLTLRLRGTFEAQLYVAPCDVGFNLAGPTPTKPLISWSGLNLISEQRLDAGRRTMRVSGTVSTYATVLSAGAPAPVVTNCVAAGVLDPGRDELFPTRAMVFLQDTAPAHVGS